MTLKKTALLLSMLFGVGAHAETTVITAMMAAADTYSVGYQLEYGFDSLQMHRDALQGRARLGDCHVHSLLRL